MLHAHHEHQHDHCIQDGEHCQKILRKAQPLGHIQAEKGVVHHVGDVKDDRHRHRLQKTGAAQQAGNQLAVFRQHPQRRNALGLLAPDATLAGLVAEPEGNEGFGGHGEGEQEIQHPHHRYHGIGVHEETGKGSEKYCHQPADGHPGVDLYQIGRVGVLDQQAKPGRLVHLFKAVERRRNKEHPEIL